MACYASLLALLFIQPLTALLVHAWSSELHSHVVLVPFIAGYLLYVRRGTLPAVDRRSMAATVILGAIGLGVVSGAHWWNASLSVNDDLALNAFSFVTLLAAGGFLFLGARWMRAAAFPFAFLLFLIPLPDAAVLWLESASVVASAEAAAFYFAVAGTPLMRDGMVFELPGIVLLVAQECSGIRSSWVLFITSILASNLFLKTPWRRLVLVAFIIPLGVLRNGFRVFVIGLLCIHVGPHMIDSIIHHRGGPLFFALSLVPLFLLLIWLRRGERPTFSHALPDVPEQPPRR